jgi:NAD(P)-dependent dehydrogenase (short-subunit alcohol dehydrogenase family)
MPDRQIAEHVIWLTGATGHLGQAIAETLATAGAHLVLSGRRSDKVDDLGERIASLGSGVTVLPFDIESAEQRELASTNIVDRLGRLDGIVNNAYAGRPGTIESTTVEDFERACAFNLSAPFHLVQLALPLLKAAGQRNAGGAAVVNIASMYGMVSPDPTIYGTSGSDNPPYYGSTKAGMIQLTRHLACHLAPWNIRVNAISPGAFPPPSIRNDKPEFYAELCSKAPMSRIGTAPEVAGPVLFLLSPAAAFITGVNLPVDGGWTAW